jgi:hypothetical protein
MKHKTFNKKNQNGQSLLETIVAIFLLTTGLTTGLGLAIYAFSNSEISLNQIIATNLASEGVDVVRAMRDSNWLASDVKGGAWDLTTCADIANKFCFPQAYQAVLPYNSYNLSVGTYRAEFNAATGAWNLSAVNSYDLYLQNNGTYTHASNSTAPIFARMISITQNAASPYTNTNSNQELIVTSIVAWRGKHCPNFVTSQDLSTFVTPCKIVTEEHLTNWKDYK